MKCDIKDQKPIPPIESSQAAVLRRYFSSMLDEILPQPRDQIELLKRIVILRGQHFVETIVQENVLFDLILRSAPETNRHDHPEAAQGTSRGP